MGRGPRSQPPGCEHTASPQRPKIAPKNITDERMRPINSFGISQPVSWRVSTTRSGPSRRTVPPRRRMICAAVSTSLRAGQPRRQQTPGQSTVAASMGSTLFLAPCTVTAPESFLPPSTKMTLIFLPRFS